MKKQLLLIIVMVLAGTSVVAAQRITRDRSIGAWVEDKNLEKDIAVRAKPTGFGKTLAEIPAVMDDKDKVIVGVTGYSNGWLRIQKAVKMDDTVIFDGDGWIVASRVSAAVYSRDGKSVGIFAAPRRTSRRIASIPPKALFDVVGFDRFGLKIRYRNKTGWISRDNVCANPFTLCS